LFDLLLDEDISLLELFEDLLLGWHWSLHPWVSEHFGNGWSMGRVKLEHGLDDVFELFREERFASLLALAMSLPEHVGSAGSDASVEWILWLGSSEWRMLCNHNEEDNSSGEQID
jgi:hypothetical protein